MLHDESLHIPECSLFEISEKIESIHQEAVFCKDLKRMRELKNLYRIYTSHYNLIAEKEVYCTTPKFY